MQKNPRRIDLAGQRFGLWSVIEQSGNARGGGTLWRCQCDCGTERDNVIGADLRHGKSSSCGCVGTLRIGRLRRTHGSSGTRLHGIWKNMRKRCLGLNDPAFPYYGGRGVSICPEWNEFSSFEKWAGETGYRDDLSIERLDVNGNYEPTNCIWANAQAQSENRRFVSKAPNGKLWWHIAQENGITSAAYRSRLSSGWSHHEAATWPFGKRRRERDRDEKGRYAPD